MLAGRIRRGKVPGRNCRGPRFSEIWKKTGPGPSKQVRNPPVHICSEGQSQVRVLASAGPASNERSNSVEPIQPDKSSFRQQIDDGRVVSGNWPVLSCDRLPG